MYVIKIKDTGKYWKSNTSEVELQDAKLYKNKEAAEDIIYFYDDIELEILEVERILKLK
jgi:hypothetical protein